MELIHYVAEKISAQKQAQMNASVRKYSMIQEAKLAKPKRSSKSFAFTLWKVEIIIKAANHVN